MARRKEQEPAADEWYLLSSSVNSLYIEMDKLEKKAPADQLSDLATKRVNRAIREAKQLMGSWDAHMEELAEFVAAGENPEIRDAVLVLSEIKAGLDRLNAAFSLNSKHSYR